MDESDWETRAYNHENNLNISFYGRKRAESIRIAWGFVAGV